MLKLKRVKEGDTIGIIAPGSPVDPLVLNQGIQALTSLGFKYKIPSDPTQNFGRSDRSFGSASVSERVDAIHSLLRDGSVSCLLAARGGYGTSEILPFLDYKLIAEKRKPIVGYSDLCSLLVASHATEKFPAIHGGMLAGEFARYSESPDARTSIDALLTLLSGGAEKRSFELDILREGEAEGWLLPVNVTILDTLVGTPWDLLFDGAILVLEDITMMPYRIHRILLHLKHAGKLRGIQGVVFGRFHHCIAKWGPDLDSVLSASPREIFDESDCPILSGLQFGHEGENQPLALGVRARIRRESFEILESPFEE